MRAIAAVAALVVGSVCGLVSSDSSRPTLPPTANWLWSDGWKPGDFAFMAEASGRLHIENVRGETCAWLGDTVPSPFRWPDGWSARLEPAELLDASGSVVAREGQQLSVGGGDAAEKNTEGRCGSSAATPWMVGGAAQVG